MKSTTSLQKIIFSIKVFACVIMLGILGWLSFDPPMSSKAGAEGGEVVISVSVTYSAPTISASSNTDVGQDVPIRGDSNNVEFVEVYLDLNNDGVIDSNDIKLSGIVNIGNDGNLNGTVYLPGGLDSGVYQLIVLGHTAHTLDGQYPETVQDLVIVNYTNSGPDIGCVHNEDSTCLPGQPEQAFGDENSETIIIIDGDNLGDTSGTTVIVGGQDCELITVSGTRIVCTVPPAQDGQTGSQDVIVCVNGICTTMKDGFVYRALTLPGVPGTGLFRIGEAVVTVKDAMLWGGLIIILASAVILIMIVKTPKSVHYSTKKGSSKKRNYNKKNIAFNQSKKIKKSPKKTSKKK